MRCNEFKEKIKCWGQKHGYVTEVRIEDLYTYIRVESNGMFRIIAAINNATTLLLDTDWPHFKKIEKHARTELFKIVTEFASTRHGDKEDEKERV